MGVNMKKKDIERFIELIKSNDFNALDDEQKKYLMDTLQCFLVNQKKKSSIMEKILGTHTKNISRYIALIVIFLLIIVGILYVLNPNETLQEISLEYWNYILPILTGVMGFMFGFEIKNK
mgnify:CR=1 FL=1